MDLWFFLIELVMLLGGALQIIITILFVTLALIAFMSLPKALTIGAIVALSSTTMVLRLLVDRSEIDSVRGRACLGILLLQDNDYYFWHHPFIRP